jgi:hypothetical protein
MENANNPKVLAVVPLPSAEERRRREIMLARVMLVAIDIVLAGEPLGLQTARDLFKEVKHTYPELVDECRPKGTPAFDHSRQSSSCTEYLSLHFSQRLT